MTNKPNNKVEEIAGEIWLATKKDFESEGIELPFSWKGVGIAYGVYVKVGEIIYQALTSSYKQGMSKERERMIEKIEKMKKNYEPIDDKRGIHDEQAVGYNRALGDIIKTLNKKI